MSYIDKNTIIVVSSFKNLVNSIVCDLRHFPFACIKKNQRKDNHANATAYNEKNKQYITVFARIYYKPSKMFVFKSVLGAHIMLTIHALCMAQRTCLRITREHWE